MTFEELALEIKLHKYFVEKGHRVMLLHENQTPPRGLRIAAAYGRNQGWLTVPKPVGWSKDHRYMVYQLELTETGQERFFNRSK